MRWLWSGAVNGTNRENLWLQGKKTIPSGNHIDNAAPSVPREALPVSEDMELARRVSRGDEAALRMLIEREGRYLFGVAHALTSNPADAEDLVQETFAAAIGSRFRGESTVRTWLVQILVRRAGMLRRRRRNHQSLDAQTAGDPGTELTEREPTAGTEARLDLSSMLASLSPEHREVIVLRELQGLTYEEMAKTLAVPRGTVESRLHRAREELRRRFKGYL
jgi:RNA polymerase sigma-70 factor, ECF subfamily